jgi:hypothetical protein
MGLWNVLTPVNVLALPPDHELVRMLAGQGYISLQAAPAEARK